MTYDKAVKLACKRAVETGRDWYVIEGEEGCRVSGNESDYGFACIYIAEPCYESQVIAD